MSVNKGPFAMKLAQHFWKQDQAIRQHGGRPLFPCWADTLKAAWRQVRAVGLVAAGAIEGVIRLSLGGWPRPAAIVAAALLRTHGPTIQPETRIRLLGMIHRHNTGAYRPDLYH